MRDAIIKTPRKKNKTTHVLGSMIGCLKFMGEHEMAH